MAKMDANGTWTHYDFGVQPVPSEEVLQNNFIGVGMYLEFHVDDFYNGEGMHGVMAGKVVEITSE